MGTAFTAMAIDSGFIESNPAGSSRLYRDELSLHHHSWIADSNLEGIVYGARINDFGFGVGGKFLFLPFTGYNEWGERESSGIISESIGIANISYNFFNNYYFSGVALGMNVKGAFRNIPEDNRDVPVHLRWFGIPGSRSLLRRDIHLRPFRPWCCRSHL